jgi:hypothetical protein
VKIGNDAFPIARYIIPLSFVYERSCARAPKLSSGAAGENLSLPNKTPFA